MFTIWKQEMSNRNKCFVQRRVPLLLLTFVVFSSLCSLAGTPPNILLIIADDMGADVMPGYNIGTNLPNTPNLDRLAQNGLTFTNVWATPVCSATRATIMTGKYGVNNGVNTVPGILSTDHTSIFNQLKQQTGDAYATCLVGKWHLGKAQDNDHPNEHGLNAFMGVMGAGVPDYYKWIKVENQTVDTCFEYVTSYFTDFAMDWINKQSQPWLMWMGHVSPHSPFQFPPAGTYSEQHEGTPNMRKYLSMIENLDYEIGRLLDSIPEEVLQNTLIVFIGDNGTPGNLLQGYTEGKGSLYQGGIHVPMIISGKGVSRMNEKENAMINTCDLFATIVHFTDESIEETGGMFNSLSFKHLLNGAEGPKRRVNYMELGKNANFPRDAYTIRDEQYKMIQYVDSIQEFYDLVNDPYETNNLLLGELSSLQQEIKNKLEQEAIAIRTGWSCKDDIQNGEETGIDCGGTCSDCQTNTGTHVNSVENVVAYPNPFNDRITINHNEQGSAISVQLFNAIGQRVNMSCVVGDNKITIDAQNCKSGLYFVSIMNPVSKGSSVFRIIKK